MYRRFANERGWRASSPRRPRRRPRRTLVLSTLLAVAGLAISTASAAQAASLVAVAQAEQGTLDGWSMARVSDPSASNGSAVAYKGNGAVKLTVMLPADADTITLRMRGEQCVGAPAFTVTVDKSPRFEDSVSSTSWTDRSRTLPLLAGTHTLELRYTNDHSALWPNACDRNLHLDAVTFSAAGSAAATSSLDTVTTRTAIPVPAGFVHQSGTRLLDGADNPIRLRGVNLGGWLMWEGWIWGSAFDYIGESAMLRNLTSLIGADAAERFRADVRANYITGSDFRAIREYGFNVVRVPFNSRLLEADAQPFVYKQSGWDVLDRMLAAAKQHGVYVVLDMHAAPCGQGMGFTSDYVGPDLLWWSVKCQDRMVAMWKAIAARYANENIIAGFDLLNESVTSDAALLGLYKRVTAAIRQVDPNHMLIYEGNDIARTFDMFSSPLDANQMLSFHDYPWMIANQDVVARMPAYDAVAERLKSPMWAGEFGQSTYADISKYVNVFDGDPLIAGWAQWTWKQSPGYPALHTLQHTPASKKLVDWVNDPSRPRPTAMEAAQGMSDFVRVMRFEHTLPDAKLRQLMVG